MALATSLTALFSAGVLLAVLSRMIGGLSSETWKTMGKILIASAIMSGVVELSEWVHLECGVGAHFLGKFSRVLIGTGLGALTYFQITRRLKIEEAEEVGRIFKRKWHT